MCESAEKLPISEARSPPDAIRTPGGGLYLLISALARVRAPWAAAPRRPLHSKRSFGTKHAMPQHPHHRALDSPAAYDASEEDNDPTTDDAADPLALAPPLHSHSLRPFFRTHVAPSIAA